MSETLTSRRILNPKIEKGSAVEAGGSRLLPKHQARRLPLRKIPVVENPSVTHVVEKTGEAGLEVLMHGWGTHIFKNTLYRRGAGATPAAWQLGRAPGLTAVGGFYG